MDKKVVTVDVGSTYIFNGDKCTITSIDLENEYIWDDTCEKLDFRDVIDLYYQINAINHVPRDEIGKVVIVGYNDNIDNPFAIKQTPEGCSNVDRITNQEQFLEEFEPLTEENINEFIEYNSIDGDVINTCDGAVHVGCTVVTRFDKLGYVDELEEVGFSLDLRHPLFIPILSVATGKQINPLPRFGFKQHLLDNGFISKGTMQARGYSGEKLVKEGGYTHVIFSDIGIILNHNDDTPIKPTKANAERIVSIAEQSMLVER